jgi:hypothetical protein
MSLEQISGVPSFAGLLPDPARWPQPAGNTPATFAQAYEKVWLAQSRDEANTASSLLLYAVGNDHEGSYDPVVLDIFPFLEFVLRDGGECARFAVMSALIDLCASFGPAAGFDSVVPEPGGEPMALFRLLRLRAQALLPLITALAGHAGPLGEEAASLAEVLTDKPGEEFLPYALNPSAWVKDFS